jgi:hypothetical protein
MDRLARRNIWQNEIVMTASVSTGWAQKYRVEELDKLIAFVRNFGDVKKRERFQAGISRFSQALFNAALADRVERDIRPKTIVQFWDKPEPPEDVRHCLESWKGLGAEHVLFNAESADAYIARYYDADVIACYRHSHHPAMQADYFRLAFLAREGGLYVDADDLYVGTEGQVPMFADKVTIMPLARARGEAGMADVAQELRTMKSGRSVYYYMNNAPIFAPARSATMRRALVRATQRIKERIAAGEKSNIHLDTGPINFSAAMMEVVLRAHVSGTPMPVDVRFDWDWMSVFQPLAYKRTDLNWRRDVPITWNEADAKRGAV